MKRCTNNAREKSAEVANALRGLLHLKGIVELYRRGCFRHEVDVAYAHIMLDRHGDNADVLDTIAANLDESYEGPGDRHRCARVFPPS